ncbi:MAG: magnesium transporter, partial [Bdellovibrionaceae bacterium]|nr:magnesium transporter [Pseudobdellovibrionaceae bacterium]
MENNDEIKTDVSQTETDSTEGHVPSLAANWPSLTLAERKEQFAALTRTDAEDLFFSLSAHDQSDLLLEASAPERRSWVRLLAPDDVADLIQEMGVEHRDAILTLLDPQTRREVTALLAYAEDNAGGLMSSRFVRLRPEMSVDEAISYLRIQAKTQVETIYYCYVLDHDQKLLGVFSFRELFSSSPGKSVTDIMHTDIVRISVDLDQEKVAQIFHQHSLLAMPVVDDEGRMKGIVTLDD